MFSSVKTKKLMIFVAMASVGLIAVGIKSPLIEPPPDSGQGLDDGALAGIAGGSPALPWCSPIADCKGDDVYCNSFDVTGLSQGDPCGTEVDYFNIWGCSNTMYDDTTCGHLPRSQVDECKNTYACTAQMDNNVLQCEGFENISSLTATRYPCN